LASTHAEQRKARAKQLEIERAQREADAAQEAAWAAERKEKADQDKEGKKKAAEAAKQKKEEDAKQQKAQEAEWAKTAAEEKAAKKKAADEAKQQASDEAKAAKAAGGSSSNGVSGDGDEEGATVTATAGTPSTHMPAAFFKADGDAPDTTTPRSSHVEAPPSAKSGGDLEGEELPAPPKAGGCCVVS
jgi:colicin import membrane protein